MNSYIYGIDCIHIHNTKSYGMIIYLHTYYVIFLAHFVDECLENKVTPLYTSNHFSLNSNTTANWTVILFKSTVTVDDTEQLNLTKNICCESEPP